MASLRRDFLPQHLKPLLEASGFDGSIAVQAAQSAAETRWLLELSDAHPWIRGVVGWVDLCSAGIEPELESLARHPRLCGIRHVVQSEPDPRFLLRPDFLRGVGVLARADLVYDILIFPAQLATAIEFVDRFPAQRFVLDHLAKPDVKRGARQPWERLVRELARRENVACKLSGLVTEADWGRWTPADLAPYLDACLAAFTPRRCLFGSDWPVCTLAADHGRVVRVVSDFIRTLSDAERAAVLAGTAARLYGLT
jgi:L-fuconolactonase